MPVKDYSHPILANGRYRIVAFSRTDAFNPDHVIGYDVLTTSGIRIRRELTLDDARARLEILLEEEGASRSPTMLPHKPRRVRR